MSHEIGVTIQVDGHEPTDRQADVLALYQHNAETFLRKDSDYGSSFENSAKIESILKHGEIRDDDLPGIAARQIFVRGLLDKMSRFYQLALLDEQQMVGDEDVQDTLLDLANYAVMLAAILDDRNTYQD